MKFNDLVTGTISRFDHKGRGVFDAPLQNGNTRPFLVPFTTIGDEVEALFIKREERCSVGKISKLLTPGPSRIKTDSLLPTPYSLPPNPGMLWAHINYDDQLLFKRDLINRAFEEAGHEERIDAVILCPPIADVTSLRRTSDELSADARRTTGDARSYYRNRMDYAFGWSGEIGLKEYGSWNRYLDLKACTLFSPDAVTILDVFRAFKKQFPDIKPWDVKKHTGDLRYVVIREGKNTGDRIIALVIKDLTRMTDDARLWLTEHLDAYANNIVLAENPAISDLSFGHTIVPLKGKETIDEVINGTRYTIQLNSFFQTNSVMAAKLQDEVAKMALGSGRRAQGAGQTDARRTTHDATILDLYCGLGFFAINLAQRDPLVRAHGYEIYKHMIELAGTNAEQNGVADRCEFTSGKAEDLSWKDIDADTVIVDPPRAGLHPKVIQTLLDKAPKTIVYVSCNYHRAVNELVKLKSKYEIRSMKALDLFPHTPHVEMVFHLTLKESD